ncbi:Uncharacterised protein [Mycobacteroides abscessus subsp. massiliense]|nr:Uncharacterised protein [Mycobacteroides abscessus subsp. massiliense]
MFRRGCRTQSRYAVADTELRQCDHVHVAFYHQNPSYLFYGGTPFI